MDAHWLWWLCAVILVIAEMFSGTLYLLAVSSGLAVAGIVALAGGSWAAQASVAALLCTASVSILYRWRRNVPAQIDNSNLSADIGQEVHIVSWQDERRARVSYRGAEWDAELVPHVLSDHERNSWRIKEVVGSHLIIE